MADEIHALNKNEIQDIDYDTYFGEMDLSDEEKEDRKKLAEKFEKIFVMLFALLSVTEKVINANGTANQCIRTDFNSL